MWRIHKCRELGMNWSRDEFLMNILRVEIIPVHVRTYLSTCAFMPKKTTNS